MILFQRPLIRSPVPAEGIDPVVIGNHPEKIPVRFRPPGYDTPNLMPLPVGSKRQWPLIPLVTGVGSHFNKISGHNENAAPARRQLKLVMLNQKDLKTIISLLHVGQGK